MSADGASTPARAARGVRPRLIVFAGGDFAFNLYWQSLMLFLLFYDTDVLGFGIAAAASVYAIASVWDAAISLAVGLFSDNWGLARVYRRILAWGAVPLAISYALCFVPIPPDRSWSFAALLGTQLVFRSVYAMINIPYLSIASRIAREERELGLVAAMRMLFGVAAAIVVSLAIDPGQDVASGQRQGLVAAILLGVVGSVVLVLVSRFGPPDLAETSTTPLRFREIGRALVRNRPFLWLSFAMVAMIVAGTLVNKSLLYFFKYRLGSESAGQLTFAAMMAISLVAVPFWLAVERGWGARRTWLAATALCVLLLLLFAIGLGDAEASATAALVGFQFAYIGLNLCLWTLLPQSVNESERELGVRVEASIFGITAMFQRLAIALATAMLGWSLHSAHFLANHALGERAFTAIRAQLSALPIAALAISSLAIAGLGYVARKPRPTPQEVAT